jgi:acetyl esterase/lipase
MSLFAMLGTTCAASAPDFDSGPRGGVTKDVVYASPEGLPQVMDIFFPKSPGPWPCVVMVHGGGWSEGDKTGFDLGLSGHGYLVASVNYRLHPDFHFPAMIEDVKAAIRFLRAHAAEYNLDPERVAILGHSAGGHLAALAGLAGKEAGWDVGDDLAYSSEVRAVVELSGPSDLRLSFPAADIEALRFSVFEAAQWEKASPVTWARAGAPPFLIIHGEKDEVVPIEHARVLHAALKRAGGTVSLVSVWNAGHGFESTGGLVWPPLPLLLFKALGFLGKALR